MGNSAPYQFVHYHFPPNNYHWQPYSTHSHTNIPNTHKLFIDKSTGIVAQKYSIKEFSSLQFQLSSLLFRKQHSSSLVTVYDILIAQTSSVIVPDCMINEHNRSFTVFLQRIPYRLADIGVIKFQEMTYVLQQCFKGLQALFKQSGKQYLIDEDLICFNTEGKCKIWINQNLSKNSPNISATFTQETIIQQVFLTLESRLETKPPEYYSKSKGKNVFTDFNHVLNFIQKVRRKLHIETDCIESLKSVQNHNKTGSGLSQAVDQGIVKGKASQQKRGEKFSLKNSRNHMGNKSIRPSKTVLSRQQTTQVSIFDLERRNMDQMEMSRFLRSSFKSVSHPQKKKSIQFSEYSEKVKRKLSPKKAQDEQKQFNKGHDLYGKFPKGPLFS